MTLRVSTTKVGATLKNGGGLLETYTLQTEDFGLCITDLKTKEKRRIDMSKGWIVKMEITSYEKVLVYTPRYEDAEKLAKDLMKNSRTYNESVTMVTSLESTEDVSPLTEKDFYGIIGGANAKKETQ